MDALNPVGFYRFNSADNDPKPEIEVTFMEESVIPEPASALLIGVGSLMLLSRRRVTQ